MTSVASVREELRHALLQHRKRHRAERQNDIVKLSLVELRAELLLRFATVPADLDLAQLVRERLGRPRDMAIDVGRNLMLG